MEGWVYCFQFPLETSVENFYFRLFTVCSTFLRIRPTPRKALTFQRCWNGFFKFTLSLITIKLFIVFIPLVRNRTVSYIEIIELRTLKIQMHAIDTVFRQICEEWGIINITSPILGEKYCMQNYTQDRNWNLFNLRLWSWHQNDLFEYPTDGFHQTRCLFLASNCKFKASSIDL